MQASNDLVSNFIAKLPIFPHYSFGLESLYGSVDGQKFESASPTIKARYSKKYFGKGRGVVAYTLLAHHIPLHTELIGAHEHESNFVFDICYHNTSNIIPTTVTGDMHSLNKANCAVLDWFGLRLAVRFTNLQAQLKHLFCGCNPANYKDLALLKKISPVAWQHLHFLGHYIFRNNKNTIDLETMLADVKLQK